MYADVGYNAETFSLESFIYVIKFINIFSFPMLKVSFKVCETWTFIFIRTAPRNWQQL